MVSPYILLSLCSFFWSLNFIIAKVVVDVIPPITIAFFRWGLPALLFLYYSWSDIKANRYVYRKHWFLLLLLGCTGYSLSAITVYEAVQFTSTINTSFINAFNPVLIALTGFLLYRYPVTRGQIAGFLLSLIGVIWILFKGNLILIRDLQANIGDIIMIINITVWSMYTVLFKQYSPLFPPSSSFAMMMTAGTLVSLPLMVIENVTIGTAWVNQIEFRHVMGIICLCLFPSVLAYRFWNMALGKIAANKVAVFQYLIPVYTVIISLLFLDEQLQQFQIIGGLLIFIGVLLVTQTFAALGKN